MPDIVVPQLLDLYMQGRFPFDRLVRMYEFDEINEAAVDAMRPKYGDLYGYDEAALPNAEMVVWAVFEYR